MKKALKYSKSKRKGGIYYEATLSGSIGGIINVCIWDNRPLVGGFHGGASISLDKHGRIGICQRNGVQSLSEIKRLLLHDINEFLNQTWEQKA